MDIEIEIDEFVNDYVDELDDINVGVVVAVVVDVGVRAFRDATAGTTRRLQSSDFFGDDTFHCFDRQVYLKVGKLLEDGIQHEIYNQVPVVVFVVILVVVGL